MHGPMCLTLANQSIRMYMLLVTYMLLALYGQGVSMYIITNEYPPMTRLSLSTFLFQVPRQGSVQYKYDICNRQRTVTKTEDDD